MKNSGSLALDKGQVDGVSLEMFDAIPDCTDDCELIEKCPYEKVGYKCGLRRRYMESVTNSLLDMVPDKTDETALHKIEAFLVPLYNQLITLNIVNLTMPPIIHGKQGVKANPLFKEIREVIKGINSLLNEITIKERTRQGSILDGDSDYYENMTSGEIPHNPKRGGARSR